MTRIIADRVKQGLINLEDLPEPVKKDVKKLLEAEGYEIAS